MLLETFYHIYNHANGFENLYQTEGNYHFFLRQWAKYIEPVAETYAYCLMPNHFHFLIKTKSEEDLLLVKPSPHLQGFENLGGMGKSSGKVIIQQFSNLFNSYTRAFNKQQERMGSLFMPNFKRKPIENDNYLTNIIFYIHHNPVHHGLSDSPFDWPHSSLHTMLSSKKTLVKRKSVLDWFGGIEEFKNLHSQALKGLEKLEMDFT
ncbi:MAG TPA: hypothetical protein PKL31_05890 [Fulvivirga sp.]|nr:hypothetical protein [Fulvivirga sp.]